MKKKLFTQYCVICLVLIFSACIAPTQAAAVEEITVGSNASMSGFAAQFGLSFTRGNWAQVEQINKEGGLLVGGKRYRINYIKYDHKYDPATSVENTKKMIYTDKVTVVLHHSATATTPVLPTLSEKKILSMDMSVGDQALRWPYNFNILPAGRSWSLSAYKALVKQFGIKTVAEVNPDNESGYTVEADDRRAAKQVGVKMVAHEFFPYETTDFYPVLTKIIAAKPDAIVMGMCLGSHTNLIVKQARELGWTGPIGMTRGSVVPKTMVEFAGKAAEGLVWSNPTHTDRNFMSEEQKKFMDYWLAEWGKPFICDTFLGYWQFNLWVQGVKKANSFDTEKVTAALEKGDFVSLGYKVHFESTPESFLRRPRALTVPMAVQTIKNGECKVIDMILPEGVEKVH